MAKKEWLTTGVDGKTFGERLEDIIKETHITQSQIAKATGVNQSGISEYINGRNGGQTVRAPDCGTIIALAKLFSVSTDYLLGLTATKSPDPNMQQAVEFTGLSEKAIKEIKELSIGDNAGKHAEILNWLFSKPEFLYSIVANMSLLKDSLSLFQKLAAEVDKQWFENYEMFCRGEHIPNGSEIEKKYSDMEKEVSEIIEVQMFRLNRDFNRAIDDFVAEFCSPTPEDHFKKRMEVLHNGHD